MELRFSLWPKVDVNPTRKKNETYSNYIHAFVAAKSQSGVKFNPRPDIKFISICLSWLILVLLFFVLLKKKKLKYSSAVNTRNL